MNAKNFAYEKRAEIIVAIVLVAVFAQLAFLSNYHSLTIDEFTNLGVGKYYVEHGDFSPFVFRDHPPLAYLINSIFLYPDGNPIWQQEPHDPFAIVNAYDIDYLLFISRLPFAFLSVILGFYIFRWSKELYGKKAAVLSTILFGFEPTLLAHSSLATTDFTAVTFIFIAMYYFWKLEKLPTLKSFAIGGIALGLALLSKHTALLLLPIAAAFFLWKYRKSVIHKANISKIALYFLIAFVMVWGAYGFQVATVLDSVHSREKALDFVNANYGGFQKDLIVTGLNAPLPAAQYFTALGYRAWHSATGATTYFLGDIYSKGVPGYHATAFLLKSPIPLLIFLGIFAFSLALRKRKINWKDEKHLIVFTVLYFLVLNFALNISIGLRHLLPIYPFLFVLLGPAVYLKFQLPSRQKAYKIAVAVLIAWYIAEAAFIFPHSLSYFNEFVGAQNGWMYLSGADVDWNQEVKALGKYLERRNYPEVKVPFIIHQLFINRYLQNYTFAPCSPENGFYAMSATDLNLQNSECYSWFKSYEPVDRVGYAILVYNITDA